MDRQNVFDIVSKHLLTQMKKSLGTWNLPGYPMAGCVYRGNKGLKCAIGCLIKDEYYNPSMEGMGCADMEVFMALKASLETEISYESDLRFLGMLQDIHDNCEPKDWESKLEDFSVEYSLKFTPQEINYE